MRNEGLSGRYSVKHLVALGLIAAGTVFYKGHDIHKQLNEPETTSPTELTGPGYSIRYSDTNVVSVSRRGVQGNRWSSPILEINGSEIPFQSPLQSTERARDRLNQACGPVIFFVQNRIVKNGKAVAHAQVTQASTCFSK